jgi:DNA-binding NarL/FixJ family response regulator
MTVWRCEIPSIGNRGVLMSIKVPIDLRDTSIAAKNRPQDDPALQRKHRMRVLLFACSPFDAQEVLRYSAGIEVAYLPSYNIEEVRTEILRFKPHLITCRADIFLNASASRPSTVVSNHSDREASGPAPLSTMLVTPRETKILAMLVQGKTNNEMAAALRLSPRTVKRTLSNLFQRFGASNRTELSNRSAMLCLHKKEI